MLSRTGCRLLILLLMTTPAAAAVQQNKPRVEVRIGSRNVFLGQAVEYQIRVSDLSNPTPKTDFPPSLRSESLGPPAIESRMHIINGVLSRSTTFVFRYRLTPDKAGRVTIPEPTVTAEGREFRGKPIVIDVTGPSPSDLFRIRSRVDRDHIYPMQRFRAELIVELKELDKPYSVISPVSARVLREAPALSIPWFADQRLPQEIVATGQLDTREWRTRDGSGFSVNGLRDFNLLSLLPPAERFVESDEAGEDRQWFRYVFSRTLLARQPGTYDLGRSALQGRLVRSIEGDQATRERVFGVTEPLVVEVRPLPLDGRPDSWIGVIGDLDVETRILPATARVGEPLTLTLNLRGSGSLADAFPPNLAANPEITDHFRVHEPTSRLMQNGRRFSWSLRAKEAGQRAFPPVELTWFDPAQEKYVTARTSPIDLEITSSEVLDADAIEAAQAEAGLTRSGGGIRANLATVRRDGVHARVWFSAWGIIAAASVIGWVVLGRDRQQRQHSRNRQQHLNDARTLLRSARTQLQDGNIGEGLAGIRAALAAICASVSGHREEGRTAQELIGELRELGFPETLIAQTQQLLEDCEAARYGSIARDARDLAEKAVTSIDGLLDAASRKGPVS